ncbi:MAG: hypothetical protein ACYS8Z_26900, partial [Planctomycetota bacterium]
MKTCSICKEIEVVPGRTEDYKKLARYHYCDTRLGPYAAIFALRPKGRLRWRADTDCAGVIVYTMPNPNIELRNIATGGLFSGLDNASQLALVNKNVRRIARVIIEPRFRGIGLAQRLVRETMPLMNVPIVEAMAVMGLVSPFFEKAGMQTYTAPTPPRNIRLIEALGSVGIQESLLVRPKWVQDRIDRLEGDAARFIEREITRFIQSFGKRRHMKAGPNRTKYVLARLTDRPAYY